MGRRKYMQGPGPVNIGGTGRRCRVYSKKKTGGGNEGAGKVSPLRENGDRHATGTLGEEMALEYLLQRGYKLLERNWRCRYKEVDLIMEWDDGLHIVEVRTRREPAAVAPEHTVGKEKQYNLVAAAGAYIRKTGYSRDVHFDIVSVVLRDLDTEVRLIHIQDAFFPIGL